MGRGSPRNKVVKWVGMAGLLLNKPKRSKDVEGGPRKP